MFFRDHWSHQRAAQLITDDLQFTYETKSGATAQGLCYLGSASGPTLAVDGLKKNRLQSPDEINFVIGYHSGAIPFGQPAYLLRSLDEVPSEFP